MKLEITYTAEDISQAQKLHVASSKWKYIGYLFWLMIFWTITNMILYPSLPVLIVNGIILLLFFPGAGFFQKYRSNTMLKKQPDLQGSLTLEIDESGTKWESNTGNSTNAWNTYMNSAVNEKMLILYKSPMLFEMIPRRVLSDENWNTLNKLVKNKISIKK